MARASLELCLGSLDSFRGAGGDNVLIELGQDDGAGSERAGPVSVDGFAVHRSGDGVLVVRSPVDTGRNEVGVRAGSLGRAVVGNVGNTGSFASGRSAHGVGVLADELAAVIDELLCAFLLSGLVVPAAGEGDFHRGGRADGTCAQEEGGVAGDNLGVGESADVADLCLVSGELTGFDHLVELHTGDDTGEVAAFIDGGESVVVVGKVLGVRLRAGGVAELDIREFLCSLDHVVLMTEGVGEDDVAAGVSQIRSGVVAFLTFGNVRLDDVFHAQSLGSFLRAVDEVQVVGGVFIMEHDEANLEVGGSGRLSGRLLGGLFGLFFRCSFGCSGLGLGFLSGSLGLGRAGCQSKNHNQCQKQGDDLFHLAIPPKFFVGCE